MPKDNEVAKMIADNVYGFSNEDIDRTAQMIQYREVTEIHDELILYGMTEVDAYFCYQAAKFLLDSGTFYPRQGKTKRF